MKLLEKILLATDFSQAAGSALQMAGYVARAFNSQLMLVHVIPETQDISLAMDTVKNTVTKQLEEIKIEIDKEGIEVAQTTVLSGTPFDQIIQQANINDVNVIIIGSGEKEREEEFRLGITAERLIRRSNKPVWVVKKGSHPVIKRILCPVDFSETSGRALSNAIHLARNFQSELTVMTVIQDLWWAYPSVSNVAAQQQGLYMKQKEPEFKRFLGKFDFYNVNWNKVVREGKPHEEILTIAREMQSDLLVMGSVGKTGLERIFMGSVAEKVVREMPCSVVTVKSEHAIRLRLEGQIADIKTHFKEGTELLEKGFPEEAIRRFEYCINKNMMLPEAWEGLAAAHAHLGHQEAAEKYKQEAKYIRQRLWEMQVEAEARKQLWHKMR